MQGGEDEGVGPAGELSLTSNLSAFSILLCCLSKCRKHPRHRPLSVLSPVVQEECFSGNQSDQGLALSFSFFHGGILDKLHPPVGLRFPSIK